MLFPAYVSRPGYEERSYWMLPCKEESMVARITAEQVLQFLERVPSRDAVSTDFKGNQELRLRFQGRAEFVQALSGIIARHLRNKTNWTFLLYSNERISPVFEEATQKLSEYGKQCLLNFAWNRCVVTIEKRCFGFFACSIIRDNESISPREEGNLL